MARQGNQPGSGHPTGGVVLPQGRQAPYVHPGVPVDAAAEAYQAGVAARRAAHQLPKTREPVAGGPTPAIPRLDAELPQPRMQAPPEPSFVERPAMGAPVMTQKDPGQLGILPMDTLPPQAQQDPDFQTGHGAMFASHQPKLALKYGVIRSGKHVPPHQLQHVNGPAGSPPKQLRPETVRDLEELARLQAQAPGTLPNDAAAEASASDAAKAAARAGDLPGTLNDAEREDLRKTVQSLDEFDFDRWRQSMMKDTLNSPEQKTIIEERLTPMDVGDLVTQGYVIQKVPIVPGKFEPAFKTTDGETDLALKRLIMEDAQSLEISDRYYLDKFSLMSVAAQLHSINGKPFPEHRDNNGNFNDEMFLKKFQMILKLPMHMLASLGVQAFWFDIRVRKLFVAEKLGNG